MKVEIVITGLCSFLNPHGKNPTMGAPSVILVSTPGGPHGGHAGTHIPFIAFDSTTTGVSDAAGFKPVEGAPHFQYLELHGVEVTIKDDPATGLRVQSSFDWKVVKKDDYWPKAANKWDRNYVPDSTPGSKPKATAVEVYIRLRSGMLKAGTPLGQEWKFPIDDDPSHFHQNRFASDVVWDELPHSSAGLTLILNDLDTNVFLHEIRFFPKASGAAVTLFVGNNTEKDIQNAVLRKQVQNADEGRHFKFLNMIADPALGPGPVPVPVVVGGGIPGEGPGGGGDGYCGPKQG